MESQIARAPRYPITMPLRYRKHGEAFWHDGKVENISRTGVLFAVQDLLDKDTEVEMTFQLPVQLNGRSAGQVVCVGKIVRVVMPPATDRPSALAAQIGSYKLFPREKPGEA
ncbi:MAG TPA: PilZ domain-containing protein [Terriglobia bacterium]|nr:PilZ domain-containing protein [Terriglobia bacterium]